jgi:DNA (cytosine-5)-methyltransferase 1
VKYLSLFSGYGGFELGIQQAYGVGTQSTNKKSKQTEPQIQFGGIGTTVEVESSVLSTDKWGEWPICIGFSEIDKYATQIYKKHFNHKEYGDIKTINPAELPDFELLVGGFPCQAFSIAGKRAGFEDTRGTLIYDVFRIIKEKHPKLVLLENVKGLLSHDNGRTFKTIITSLAELGYAVEWQVLNAKNFGVPQNRERVFIIGHLGGFGGRQVFPIGEDDKLSTKRQGKISPTITSRYYKQGQSDPYIVAEKSESSEQSLSQERIKSDNSDSRGGQTHSTDFRIRRLTPTECERLMGLPDGWTEGVSDTQRYKMAGNGVVVNVVKEIIKRLL